MVVCGSICNLTHYLLSQTQASRSFNPYYLSTTGTPSSSDLDSVGAPYASTILETLPPVQSRSISDYFPSATVEAKDFLRTTLLFSPGKYDD